jgi:hypothetical protein
MSIVGAAVTTIARSSMVVKPNRGRSRHGVLSVLPVVILACGLLPALAQAQFSQQAKLVGTDSIGSPNQGVSVALSGDGNTAIVGGPGDDSNGAAWVFSRAGGAWRQQAKLVDTTVEVSQFSAQQGGSVALSGDGNTAIVGGPLDNQAAGAAWVYTRSAGVWSQQAKLVGTEAIGSAAQGTSVALSDDGNTAIVGGPNDNFGAGRVGVHALGRGRRIPRR